jgi:acyl carrier protein
MSSDTELKIREIIAEQAVMDLDQVTLDSTPEELGLDSLSMVEIVFAIEEAFDISVPFNANEPGTSDFDISSVGAIAKAVDALIASQA